MRLDRRFGECDLDDSTSFPGTQATTSGNQCCTIDALSARRPSRHKNLTVPFFCGHHVPSRVFYRIGSRSTVCMKLHNRFHNRSLVGTHIRRCAGTLGISAEQSTVPIGKPRLFYSSRLCGSRCAVRNQSPGCHSCVCTCVGSAFSLKPSGRRRWATAQPEPPPTDACMVRWRSANLAATAKLLIARPKRESGRPDSLRYQRPLPEKELTVTQCEAAAAMALLPESAWLDVFNTRKSFDREASAAFLH